MILKSDAKFKVKLNCGFKYDMKDLVNFHPTSQKSESFTLMGYFCPKYMWFELKNTEELSFMTHEKTLNLWFQKWKEQLGDNFH